jgi:hypothetical protein
MKKVCTACKLNLPIECFYKSRNSYYGCCKFCERTKRVLRSRGELLPNFADHTESIIRLRKTAEKAVNRKAELLALIKNLERITNENKSV